MKPCTITTLARACWIAAALLLTLGALALLVTGGCLGH